MKQRSCRNGKVKGSRRRRKQRRGLFIHGAVAAARVEICWSLARLSVRPSVPPPVCHGDHRTRVLRPGGWRGFPSLDPVASIC